MKKILSVLLITVMVLMLASCGSGGGSGKSLDITGYYELTGLTSSSGTETTEEDIQMLKELGLVATLECFEDGTAVLDLFGEKMDLTYDTQKMIFVIEGQETKFNYDGGKIMITEGDDSLTFTPAEKP